MHFKNRQEAGKLLAKKLKKYKGKDVVVYALPRGGVVTAVEIAKYLDAPLDLIITRKIGHPYNPEYAIAAIAENGDFIGSARELEVVDKEWLRKEIEHQKLEAKRRREKYLAGRKEITAEGKIAILVDDGVATGLTMRAGIRELLHHHPKKIVVAVPVIPSNTAEIIKKEAGDLVALNIPSDSDFLGSVGAYYEDFSPVEDEEVITILKSYDEQRKEKAKQILPSISKQLDPILFSFSTHKYMIEKFKEIPNLNIGKFELERFPNRELHLMLHSHVAERDCVVLGSIAPPEKNLFAFLLLCHTLKKEEAHSITAVLPYLAYSRQDKKEYQRSYATALIGELLKTSGVDQVLTVDVHSLHVKQLFPIPLISLSPAKIFAEEVQKLSIKDITIVAPDEGAIKRAEAVRREAGVKNELAYLIKKRAVNGIKLLDLHGKLSKTVVIVDDILDTGKTLLACCEKLQEKGVRNIYIMVTHGLFSGKDWDELWNYGVKRIYCTDTLPLPRHLPSKNITVISIIPLLVEELKEEYEGVFTIEKKDRYSFFDYDEPLINKMKKLIQIPINNESLEGMLVIPSRAKGMVLFAHGSGSSRLSPRNNFVAEVLQRAGIGTLLIDLLTEDEDKVYETRFDIDLLSRRLIEIIHWLQKQPETKNLTIGIFGASTGAAAALRAAAHLKNNIRALVSRGGRPDLAMEVLDKVVSPTLLIVGGNDYGVIELNELAYKRFHCEKKLEIIPGATHLFEEKGALEKVAQLAVNWFERYL